MTVRRCRTLLHRAVCDVHLPQRGERRLMLIHGLRAQTC